MRSVLGRMAGVMTLAAAGLAAPVGADVITSVNGVYQDTTGVTSNNPPGATACNGSTYCYIVFNKVPSGKQLIARHISCQLNVSDASAEVTQLYLEAQKGDGTLNWYERFQFMHSEVRPSTTPGSNLIANEDVLMVINQNQRPEVYIQVSSAANILGTCSISGDLVALP